LFDFWDSGGGWDVFLCFGGACSFKNFNKFSGDILSLNEIGWDSDGFTTNTAGNDFTLYWLTNDFSVCLISPKSNLPLNSAERLFNKLGVCGLSVNTNTFVPSY